MNRKNEIMKEKLKLFFCFVMLFTLPLVPVFAALEDEDEDILIEGKSDSGDDLLQEDAKEEENRRIRTKKLQMQQWLKTLNSLKRSKKEAPLLAIISKILNQDSDNIQALSALGVFYLQSGKIQLAKIIFTRALQKHPKNSSLHSNLAVIALKEGKKKEAVEAFQKSLGYQYSNYSAAANLGTLYMQAYEYNYASEYLSLAYNRAKQYLSITHYEVLKIGNNYAIALSWSGNFQKSEDIFQELIKNNPGAVELLLNYAILLGKDLKDKNKAYQFLQRADLMDKAGRHARKIKALRKYIRTNKTAQKRKGLK